MEARPGSVEIAEKAVELVDGDITEADEPEFDPDVIY